MAKNPATIPSGKSFLAGTGLKRLQEMQKKEANPKAALRLLACIKRKQDMSIREIAGDMNMPYATVRSWVLRMARNGLDGRYDVVRSGPACLLSEDQLVQLRADLVSGPRDCGLEASVWSVPLVIKHVSKKYGTDCKYAGMYDLLGRIGFVYKRRVPGNPKEITRSQKIAFKKPSRTSSSTKRWDMRSLQRTRPRI